MSGILRLCSGSDVNLGTAALLRAHSTKSTSFSNYTQRGTPAMRFQATMVSAPGFECTASDAQRKFMVSFFLEDSTLAIAEPPNSATRTGTDCLHWPQEISIGCYNLIGQEICLALPAPAQAVQAGPISSQGNTP